MVEYYLKEGRVFAKCIPTGRYNKNHADVFYLDGMPDETNIDKTCYRKFCMENMPEPDQFPPTKDKLTQNSILTNYDAYVWKRALVTNRNVPSHIDHGWEGNDDQLSVVWMENQPAPESMLKLITCMCHKSNYTNSYQCRVLLMECVDVCKCQGLCRNIIYDSVESDDDKFEEDNKIDNADNNT